MDNGIERAKKLAKDAQANYATLAKEAESKAVRWEWGTENFHSYQPAYFELNKYSRGKPLAGEPEPPVAGSVGCGFDEEGRVVKEVRQTGSKDQYYETFYQHLPEGIASFYFSVDREKPWINVSWYAFKEDRVVEVCTAYAAGSASKKAYKYNNAGLAIACETVDGGTGKVERRLEIEYDSDGEIVRTFWCYPPEDERSIYFERPPEDATLKAVHPQLLKELTSEIIENLRCSELNREYYTMVFYHIGAAYEHRMPEEIWLGSSAERDQILKDSPKDASWDLWNPEEWSERDEVYFKFSPELQRKCDLVNQDIWQNDLEDEAMDFLKELARSLTSSELPIKTTDDFQALVIRVDVGEYSEDVIDQVDEATAKTFRERGMIK
ncbi:hypothetical protein OAU50_04605 [Planctomycetota bacterium]|nr:hypothetical protein [Planctomycetota bacterium]